MTVVYDGHGDPAVGEAEGGGPERRAPQTELGVSDGVVLVGLSQVGLQVHWSSPVDFRGLCHGGDVGLVLAVEDEPDGGLREEDENEDPGPADDRDTELEVDPVGEKPGEETACRRSSYSRGDTLSYLLAASPRAKGTERRLVIKAKMVTRPQPDLVSLLRISSTSIQASK